MMKVPMLEKAERYLEGISDFGSMNLNSLLEYHHIHQYFENGLFLERWTEVQKSSYRKIIKTAFITLRKYLYDLRDKDFIGVIDELEFDNRSNFWEVFRYFEVYKKIERKTFEKILDAHPHHVRYILPLKQIVAHFNTELRAFLLTYEESAELLLTHYEQKHDEPSEYYFPTDLNDTDKQDIIAAYLDSPSPNLNYVDLALHSKHLKLPPRLLLKAKQTSERVKDELLTEENSIKISGRAALNMDQSEAVIFEGEGEELTTVYGGAFFDSIENDLKLFSVFSPVFLYTNQEGLINLVSKHTELNILEKIGMQSKNEYLYGMYFAKKDMDALNQLMIFDLYLHKKGRSIENLLHLVIHGLFNSYFKIPGLTFSMPDAGLKPVDKIRLLAPEMEYLLKQYKNFVSNGEISHELLQMDSSQVYFSDIPSLLERKYIYSDHGSIRTIQYHFFDQDSVLADRKDSNGRRTLMKAFEAGKVYRSDFEDYQQQFIDQAVEAGDLLINDDGEVLMADPIRVIVAGKLRENGFISYWHYHKPFRDEIDRLIAEGLLRTSDKLLTSEEVNYFNFYLNKREYTNGKDLRNKYLHGSNIRDEHQQRADYHYFLRTFILILLKLRDDVTLYKHHYGSSLNRKS
ncbi:hypothetical protein [Mucilaginibacter sp. CSA2-8R]|uniref:hypothetical protein n=1 Tax=Mucilaginibacter sp. CSA2-8R TaxID=3141542 RepID=UPI00315D72F4